MSDIIDCSQFETIPVSIEYITIMTMMRYKISVSFNEKKQNE